jgi:hypothetical protein
MMSLQTPINHLTDHIEVAKQAGEPVFSIDSDGKSFQSYGTTFHISFQDPALLNALMLTFAFAIKGNVIDAECLSYKSKAIGYLNERIGQEEPAVSEGTIRAILLLAGVEVCGLKAQRDDGCHGIVYSPASRRMLGCAPTSRFI